MENLLPADTLGGSPDQLWPWQKDCVASQLVARSQGAWLSNLPEASDHQPARQVGWDTMLGPSLGKGFPKAPGLEGAGLTLSPLPPPITSTTRPPAFPAPQAPLSCVLTPTVVTTGMQTPLPSPPSIESPGPHPWVRVGFLQDGSKLWKLLGAFSPLRSPVPTP